MAVVGKTTKTMMASLAGCVSRDSGRFEADLGRVNALFSHLLGLLSSFTKGASRAPPKLAPNVGQIKRKISLHKNILSNMLPVARMIIVLLMTTNLKEATNTGLASFVFQFVSFSLYDI